MTSFGDANERRRILRALIAEPEVAVLPGVFDGFSAKLVEQYGYKAAFVTGSGVAESRFGVPDVGLVGLSESLSGASVVAQRTSLALIADADTGYGSPVNVAFTIRAFEDAGLSGVLIEDQVWPKRCGHMAGKETISLKEMAMKVRAAADARQDSDFVILARTDAAATEGVDAAIERASAYADEGADLLFADALLSIRDIERFAAAAKAPVLVNMGFGVRSRRTTPQLSLTQLKELGVAVAIYPRMLTAAAIMGMKRALDVFEVDCRTGETSDREDLLVSFEELNELIGLGEISELEARYAV